MNFIKIDLDKIKLYSNAQFFVAALITATLVWLVTGGIVEQFFVWYKPETTIKRVKDVSQWYKWTVFGISFVSLWLVRWHQRGVFED